jgi:hypothetical protein
MTNQSFDFTGTGVPTQVAMGNNLQVIVPNNTLQCPHKSPTVVGSLRCRKDNGTYTCVTWKIFYAACHRGQFNCNTNSAAFVPAVTICAQRLF